MERERRRRARREIVSLCHSGLDVDTLIGETMRQVRHQVPYDRLCWHTVDPATLLFTSATEENLGNEPRLPAYEYGIPDVNKWTHLARRSRPVGVLGEATHGHPEQSPRFRDLLAPRGIGHELRASFVSDGQCWGYLGLYRDRGRRDFGDDETGFVLDVDAHIADGMRRALLIGAVTAPLAEAQTPGVVLVDAAGQISGMNASAEGLLAVLPGRRSDGERVPHPVLAIAAQARRAAAGADLTSARSRVRTVTGQWVVLHGTQLGGAATADTAVIIEAARPAELAELVVLAYGLTRRERDVTRLVLLGWSTLRIADELHLSPFTVQDYLKSIFEKVGVRSRRELVATVFRDTYWPRILAGAKH
jgi:DNA-binding CsgD family transcriptional regulator